MRANKVRRLSLAEILEVLYRGRTMVNFSHVPSVTRAIDWLSQEFREAVERPVSRTKRSRRKVGGAS